MSRQLFLAIVAVFSLSAVVQAQVLPGSPYANVYWAGGDGDWTGVHTNNADPNDYQVGNWTAPDGTANLPAAKVFGRRDGLRVGQVDGNAVVAGVQQGTDVYINTGATVTYNSNRHLFYDPNPTTANTPRRFGDFRFQNNQGAPLAALPSLNISNGSILTMGTDAGGDADGNWTRWNGSEMNLDNGTFRRTADLGLGLSGGAFMFASFHGFDHSVQTFSLTNGGTLDNEGQAWFGVSSFDLLGDNAADIRVVVTVNNGHMNFHGGDQYELDNDNLPLRADLAFIYGRKPNSDPDPTDDELFVINFTGPGDITVNGDVANPVDGDTSTGGGGIRVARQTGTTHQEVVSGVLRDVADYEGRTEQKSYQDLWNLGILRANNLSGLTGANFNDYFSVTNTPGSTGYKLTSLIPSPPASLKSRGDFNNDGVVDGADYVLWRKTVGSTTNLQADANGSLHIDAADYIHWRDNFGAPPGSGSGLTGGAVPEPSTTVFVLIGLAVIGLFKRR